MNEKSGLWLALAGVSLVWLLPIQGNLMGQGGVTVNKIVIAKDVADRTPVDPGTEFTPDVGELYCFTAVNNPGDRVTLTHVWSHEGEEVTRVDISIGRSPNWRTWSIKTIDPDWTGSWTVTVVDTGGLEIASTDFMISGMEMAPEMPEEEEMEMEEPEMEEMEMEMGEPEMEEMEMGEPEMEEMEMEEPEMEEMEMEEPEMEEMEMEEPEMEEMEMPEAEAEPDTATRQ